MLVGDWRFYRGTLKDFSGNGNDGTPTGTSWRRAGSLYVVDFVGTDRIIVADSPDLQLTDLTLIVFGTGFDTYGVSDRLLSKRDAGGINYDFTFRSATKIALIGPGGSLSEATINWGGSKFLAVTCVASGSSKPKFYRDGVFISDGHAVSNIAVNDAPLVIGNYYSGAAPLSSPLAGAKIFNEVLSPDQIAYEFEQTQRLISPILPKKHFVFPSRITGREKGILGAWSGEAIAGKMTDLTSGGHDGTITGPVEQTRGLVGNALKFGGGATPSKVLFGDVAEFESLAAATVCFWAKSDDWTGNQAWVHKMYSVNYHRWAMHSDGTNMLFGVGNGTNWRAGLKTLPSDNGWHFFLGIYDGTDITCYVDNITGTPVAQTGNMGGSGNSFDFEIGYFTQWDTWQAKGAICGVRLFDKALTAAERTALYLEGARVPMLLDDLRDYPVSLANETVGELSDSRWNILTGTWKIQDKTSGLPGEKDVYCVNDGTLSFQVDLDGLTGHGYVKTLAGDFSGDEGGTVDAAASLSYTNNRLVLTATAGQKMSEILITLGVC